MLSLLKKKKQSKDSPEAEPEKEDKPKSNEEIDYSKLLEDEPEPTKKPEIEKTPISSSEPEPVSTPTPLPNTSNMDIIEVKETLSGIYALLEKQNKILENLTGMQTINKHDTELDEIDNSIIKIIENGEIDARKLQRTILEQKICSVSTLFLHLKKLVKLGVVKKSRKKQFMLYFINKNPPELQE